MNYKPVTTTAVYLGVFYVGFGVTGLIVCAIIAAAVIFRENLLKLLG